MQRRLLACFLLSVATAAVFASACTSTLESGCLGGPCGPDSLSTSTSSSSGAGGGSCAATPPPATGDYPCAVFDVINRNCRPCHQMPTMQGAPFPLMNFEDTQQPYLGDPPKKIYEQMNIQIRSGAIPRMPLGADFTNATLQADLKVLGDWLTMCAPPVADGTGCACPGMGCSPP